MLYQFLEFNFNVKLKALVVDCHISLSSRPSVSLYDIVAGNIL